MVTKDRKKTVIQQNRQRIHIYYVRQERKARCIMKKNHRMRKKRGIWKNLRNLRRKSEARTERMNQKYPLNIFLRNPYKESKIDNAEN